MHVEGCGSQSSAQPSIDPGVRPNGIDSLYRDGNISVTHTQVLNHRKITPHEEDSRRRRCCRDPCGLCFSPLGDAQQDEALKTFSIAPDKAGVYIYRNESMGAAIRMDVELDGKPIGQTAAKTYLYKELTPGKHVISSKAENTDTVEVEAKAGTLLYIWQEVKMGILSARTKLRVVDEAQGRKGVQETKLAETK